MQAVLKNNFAPAAERAAAARALELPPLPFAWAELWGDFLLLDRRRPPAMSGIAAIPIAEIEGLGRALRGGYAHHEIEALLTLDTIRLQVAAESIDTSLRALTAEEGN